MGLVRHDSHWGPEGLGVLVLGFADAVATLHTSILAVLPPVIGTMTVVTATAGLEAGVVPVALVPAATWRLKHGALAAMSRPSRV